ncbi:glucans biosynthesis glucosyltransferase MdoH [Pseudooceanicola marinus]|uniref:glucans biosynthesis glucosyltransferase MdoH n=1 Tax=Pseudooceanicola marinus TaxID=396013 RepID=UPI001CD4C7E0|nr:glucans biosynthesis glucosyltransferase MdoH [Pseudooceanicola marinus]MCA1336262.1 glucans biosynthesis glucosyltransferase MdoH [Pseudooceanicola marinus]
MGERRWARADTATRVTRAVALTLAAAAALTATGFMADAALADGFDWLDVLRSALVCVTTAWLAWGAVQAMAGLAPRRRAARQDAVEQAAGSDVPQSAASDTADRELVLLVPICNEDPVATFSRIAAMDASLHEAGVSADFAVLSDTRDEEAARAERDAFARLLAETGAGGRMFYRRRQDNWGRKAGNVEDFIRRSGGAWDYALVLDADSLMEGRAVAQMLDRMRAEPDLGLLQTLPNLHSARSVFGRALQFSAAFFSPVFSRGLARMQGRTGPFWGHNAMIRIRAFAESCALPPLRGRPPFGGPILSHDYVEAALLARAGWRVTLDETIPGSYEEGPDNILSFARRDRRWCQGNLQHIRLLTTPGLHPWSRFTFLQGIFSYLVSLVWGLFLVTSITAAIWAPLPDYFPDPHQLFPVFPSDRTRQILALGIGVLGLLVLPKLAILAGALISGRARQGFGGWRAAPSMLAELLLSSMLAPLHLAYQTRAVLQVLSGADGGWPANQRGEGRLTFGESLAAGAWISVIGAVGLGLVAWVAPELTLWLLPVGGPMLLAPLLIWASSLPLDNWLFRSPEEGDPAPVITRWREIHGRWTGAPAEDQAQAGAARAVAPQGLPAE